jgi:hypothetical protein
MDYLFEDQAGLPPLEVTYHVVSMDTIIRLFKTPTQGRIEDQQPNRKTLDDRINH